MSASRNDCNVAGAAPSIPQSRYMALILSLVLASPTAASTVSRLVAVSKSSVINDSREMAFSSSRSTMEPSSFSSSTELSSMVGALLPAILEIIATTKSTATTPASTMATHAPTNEDKALRKNFFMFR